LPAGAKNAGRRGGGWLCVSGIFLIQNNNLHPVKLAPSLLLTGKDKFALSGQTSRVAVQAFQLRIDLGGMGGMQGAAMGGGSGGQSGADGAFAGMVANAGASDAGAQQSAPASPAASASAQASGKGLGAENLQVLQPEAPAEALPAGPVAVEIAAPGQPGAGAGVAGQVPDQIAGDDALDDAAATDDASSLTDEMPVVMAFAMPAPLPAPQVAVSVPLDGATDGVLDGAGGLDALDGTDGLRGSIQPFAPSLPQAGSDAAGGQPGLNPPGAPMTGEPETEALPIGAQPAGAQAGGLTQPDAEPAALSVAGAQGAASRMPQAIVEGAQPAVASAVLPAVTDTGTQQVPSIPRETVLPASASGLEAALADAGLTAGSGEAVSEDLLKQAVTPAGAMFNAQAFAADAQADAAAASGGQNQTQQTQAQPATAQQPPVPAQPAVAQTSNEVLQPRAASVDALAQAAADDAEPGAIETLRFAFSASAGTEATAAVAKPELAAQQAVASSAVTDTSDSLMQTAIDDAVSAREAASTAVAETVEERLADQESSRYKLPSGEGTPLAGQSASARGTQASDLAGASAAINGAQAAAGAASPDAAEADAASDPVVALDGRPGQMDFTGFGRADGTMGPMAGTAQAGTAGTAGQMPTQAQAQAAASQVAGQIQLQSRAGQSRFQMRLDPPELGRIEVHMKVKSGGEVEAHLIVDKPETLDMFMRDQKGLERALEQAGLKADQGALQFSLRDEGSSRQFAFSGDGQGNGSGQQGRQDQQQGQDSLTAEQGIAERVVQLYRQNGRSGVDIRI
jgi:flagellar hook-length control protein FliK